MNTLSWPSSARHLLPLLCVLVGCVPDLTTSGQNAGPWEAPENQWPLAEPPSGLVVTGFAEGQVPPDFRLLDQHGDEVSLWQFYGSVVLLDVSTMWCGPCQEVAKHTEETYEAFKDDDFMYLTVLQQDVHNEDPDLEDLNEWAEMFEITAPILADPQGQATGPVVQQNQFPALLIIDRDLTVHTRVGQASDAALTEAVDALL